MTPDRIRFVVALLALAACKENTGLNEKVIDGDPSTADDGGTPPAPPRDAGGFQLPPFDWGSLFPQRDAGRPAQPVDAGRMPTTPSMPVRMRLGPQGGTLQGDGIALDAPRGAVTRSVEITFGTLPNPPAGFSGRAFLLEPSDTTFAVPVRVAIQLTPEVLAIAPANEWAVATLMNGAWVALPNQGNDAGSVFVEGTTQVLGAFALIRVEPRPGGLVRDGGVADASVPPSDAGAPVDAGPLDAGPVDAGPTTFCQPGACANGVCVEGLTDFGCMCNTGFGLGPDLHSCVDVNECTNGTATCPGGKTCENTPGTYACVCAAGTEETPAGTCAVPGTYCTATSCAPGSCTQGATDFTCTCPAGYAGNGTKLCVDVDECSLGLSLCAAGKTCTNSVGSYSCVCDAPTVEQADGTCAAPCPAGFTGYGTACTDIDECTGGTASCPIPGTVCTNTPGSYTCDCAPGTTLDAATNTCVAPVAPPPVAPPVMPPTM